MPKLTTAIFEGTGFESFCFVFCFEVCHFYLLENFVTLGLWGAFSFVFAKYNMEADAAVLVCYADLVKLFFTYIACYLCF